MSLEKVSPKSWFGSWFAGTAEKTGENRLSKLFSATNEEGNQSVWERFKQNVHAIKQSATEFVKRQHPDDLKAAGVLTAVIAGAVFGFRRAGAKTPVIANATPKVPAQPELNKAAPQPSNKVSAFLSEKAGPIKDWAMKKFDVNALSKDKIVEFAQKHKREIMGAAAVVGIAFVHAKLARSLALKEAKMNAEVQALLARGNPWQEPTAKVAARQKYFQRKGIEFDNKKDEVRESLGGLGVQKQQRAQENRKNALLNRCAQTKINQERQTRAKEKFAALLLIPFDPQAQQMPSPVAPQPQPTTTHHTPNPATLRLEGTYEQEQTHKQEVASAQANFNAMLAAQGKPPVFHFPPTIFDRA